MMIELWIRIVPYNAVNHKNMFVFLVEFQVIIVYIYIRGVFQKYAEKSHNFTSAA